MKQFTVINSHSDGEALDAWTFNSESEAIQECVRLNKEGHEVIMIEGTNLKTRVVVTDSNDEFYAVEDA